MAARGVDVCLPRSYVGVLRDAVVKNHRCVDDPEGTPDVTEAPRYPFQYIRAGTREEYLSMFKE